MKISISQDHKKKKENELRYRKTFFLFFCYKFYKYCFYFRCHYRGTGIILVMAFALVSCFLLFLNQTKIPIMKT